MNNFDWIMSEGGPLICAEAAVAASWGGIDRLTVVTPGATTDYDRGCKSNRKALTSAPLQEGAALFFQGPFDTSFWKRAADGKVFVIRIEACEIDIDFQKVMEDLDEGIFSTPLEILRFSFREPEFIIFDSAETGNESDKKIVRFQIKPATYNILSRFHETDQYSVLLHRFDAVDEDSPQTTRV